MRKPRGSINPKVLEKNNNDEDISPKVYKVSTVNDNVIISQKL